MVAAYTPTYYDEAVGLPAPEGIYGKEVHSTKTGAAQINEARLLLDLIQTQDPIQYAKLTDTSAPMPVLMKVPGQSKVRMLLGLAPYVGTRLYKQTHLSMENFSPSRRILMSLVRHHR